jgi:glycosyltransferase involved in cell wall biosynthesis
VLNQTYQNIEYIIVDGLSRDTTVDIIQKYESSFNGRMNWISEPDNGLYDAMNKGIRMAKGDVIGIINSDDLFCDKHAIEKVMQIFAENESLDSVYADLFYVAQNETSKIARRWITGRQKQFKYGWHPAHPTLYIKKEVYNKYGLFNLDFKLAADFEIMLRFLEKYEISTSYIQEAFVKMRLGGETNKSLKNIYTQNVECIRAFRINGLKVNSLLYPFFRILPKLLQFKK